jgi:hypothetical protein
MRASSDGADRHVLLQTEVQLSRGAHNGSHVRFSLLLFVREHSPVLPSSGVSALSTTESQHPGANQRATDQGEIHPGLVPLLVSVKEARHAVRFHSRCAES